MIEFMHWLIERRGQWNVNNTIVVDIQPEYQNYLNFDMTAFAEFLLETLRRGRKVLYFYNGETIGSQDTDSEIVTWLTYAALGMHQEYDDYEYDDSYEERAQEIEKLFSRIIFYDKGYGFFRGWMDSGVDDREIIQTIRYMVMKRVWDSREIPEEELEQLVSDAPDYDPIYLPHINLAQLKQFSGGFLCGGGKNECLKEVQLLMNALNIRYKLLSQFTY